MPPEPPTVRREPPPIAVRSSANAPAIPYAGTPGARGQPGSADEKRRWLALAALLTGNFVTILDLFIVNVAIPSIQTHLRASFAEVQLVIVGYSAAYGVCLMNGARLGDLFGRKRIFIAGMGVFTAASLLCGLSFDPTMLIAARVLQGLGAAILMPQVLASLRVLFDGDARRRAFGIMGAVQGLAATISQLAGGFLIERDPGGMGWRAVFLVNLPIGIAALVAGHLYIVENRAPVRARLDARGALAGALGLFLLLVPIMEGREYGWPWWSIVAPAASLLVFAYFVRHEKSLSARGRVPIIDVSLFRNLRFVAGVIAVFAFYSAISSFFLSLTMLLQFGLGMSPLAAGAVFTPSAIAFFAGSLAGPRLTRRFGQATLLTGVLVFACGLALAAVTAASAVQSVPLMIVALVLNGAGQGMVIPLALSAILGAVRESEAGMGSGAVSTMQTVGTSVGVAIVGVLLFSSIGQAAAIPPALRPAVYGHAFAVATLYNVGAAIVSFVMFRLANTRGGFA
jgi:MFS family permease